MQIEAIRSRKSPAPPLTGSAAGKGSRWSHWLPVFTLIAFLLAWEMLVRLGDYPPFILPAPGQVARKLLTVLADGTLARHSAITLIEVLGGLALGVTVATVLGYALAKSVTVERALSPYLVASQAIPIVAIAPLLVLWFGSGLTSKILISALIVFFPILINTIAGVRGVPPDLRDLMRSLHATPWQVFIKLEVPAALPVLLAGLKVGATLSVIGAVVGEFAGANAGLGVMINVADGQYDTARMFVGVLALVVMALSLYGAVALLERRLLAWRQAGSA
ncbi:MAG TPA: ABC transporter permease [Chloroflexi bacterium]|nr:ABC transporter permease [Chloroflexota bacterium]